MSITSQQHQGSRRTHHQLKPCATVHLSTGRRALITSNLLQARHRPAKARQSTAKAHSAAASQHPLAPFPAARSGLFSHRRAATTVGAISTPTSAPAIPEEFPIYQHRIWSPLSAPADAVSSLDGSTYTDALLVIVPGAFLSADAFQPLVTALQAASPRSRLWVTVLNFDATDLLAKLCGPNASFQDLGPAMDAADGYNKLLNQAVDQAVEQGFVAQREWGVKGRIANMVMLCQSAGGLMAPLAARAAAATILLACAPNVGEYSQQNIISLETWPRPLMIVAGELDGQMRWPWLSPYIVESAVLATKLGPRLAATTKPVLVLPGINHGNTSNGEVRTARGDIKAGVAPYDKCMQRLAGCIVPFIAAHTSASESEREKASTTLLAAVRETAHLTAPYCRAAGLGDPTAPYTTRPHDRPQPPYGGCGAGDDTSPVRVGQLVAGTQRVAATSKSSALSPGAVVAAEAAAVSAQIAVLSALPAAERERLRVVATAHTDVETFLYSHPEMEHISGDLWVLHVHVLVHFRSLDVPGLIMTPTAPDYTLKLRNAAFVAAMLGLSQPSQYPTPRPATLHNLSLEAALAAVPPAVEQRYRKLGRTLQFGDDIDVLAPGPDGTLPRSPEVFVRQSRITFTYPPRPSDDGAAPVEAPSSHAPPSAGPVRVGSPYLVMLPPDDIASRSRNEARYTGVFYTKLMSLAQIMEWVWVDCLREAASPW